MALSARQARFVAEYLKSHNGSEAAILAGYGKRGARSQASRLLTLPEIVNRLTKARVNVMEELRGAEITVSRVAEEAARVAFLDPAEMFKNGKLLPVEEMPEHVRRAITGYEQNDFGPKVRMAAKMSAIDFLGKHLGMIKQPEQPQTPNLGFQINIIMGDD